MTLGMTWFFLSCLTFMAFQDNGSPTFTFKIWSWCKMIQVRCRRQSRYSALGSSRNREILVDFGVWLLSSDVFCSFGVPTRIFGVWLLFMSSIGLDWRYMCLMFKIGGCRHGDVRVGLFNALQLCSVCGNDITILYCCQRKRVWQRWIFLLNWEMFSLEYWSVQQIVSVWCALSAPLKIAGIFLEESSDKSFWLLNNNSFLLLNNGVSSWVWVP